jgi:hypothetical protein
MSNDEEERTREKSSGFHPLRPIREKHFFIKESGRNYPSYFEYILIVPHRGSGDFGHGFLLKVTFLSASQEIENVNWRPLLKRSFTCGHFQV